jgi:hypothetical protein
MFKAWLLQAIGGIRDRLRDTLMSYRVKSGNASMICRAWKKRGKHHERIASL